MQAYSPGLLSKDIHTPPPGYRGADWSSRDGASTTTTTHPTVSSQRPARGSVDWPSSGETERRESSPAPGSSAGLTVKIVRRESQL